MALARFALKNSQKKVIPSYPDFPFSRVLNGAVGREYGIDDQMAIRMFSTGSPISDDQKVRDEGQIKVDEGESGRKKSKLFPMSLSGKGKGGGLWRRNSANRDVNPFDLQYLFPSGLGDALLQASENFNRVLENLSPTRLIGRLKERDDSYKIKYEVPGLSKEDIKITVEDGVLMITGEHKEEDGSEEDEDEHWSSSSYYSASLVLPDDAKIDEVKAEMKDGVLCITIPKTEMPKKDVKEVPIH